MHFWFYLRLFCLMAGGSAYPGLAANALDQTVAVRQTAPAYSLAQDSSGLGAGGSVRKFGPAAANFFDRTTAIFSRSGY
jgi:hypothetical protein